MGLLTPLDLAVVALYFGAVVGIGLFFGRFTQSTADFFFAGQRFAWWPIAISCVATLVGSYSFINYSDLGYDHGLSSAVYYTNDWFILPLFLLGWMPILYFSRAASIPEYFERRFDRRTRGAVMVIALLFLIGYIGMNLQTIGVVANRLMGTPVMLGALIIAVLSLLYMHHGGQMSVLATDLFQGFLLLATGLGVLLFGVWALGGWEPLWAGLAGKYQAPFPAFNEPTSYHFAGTFWGDAFSGTIAFFFINQGMVLRFLSAKSVADGRKAMIVTVLVLMPLAAIAVSSGGWVGRAMVGLGLEGAPTKEKGIFVTVAQMVAAPGFFGLTVAALLAALMSTLDTYINAVSAIGVNDILKPLRRGRNDAYYLGAARWIAVGATLLGLCLVPLFELSDTIYKAHSTFFACTNPPLVVVILLGCMWKRFTAPAAFWALVLGTALTLLSLALPQLITPIAHGVRPDDNYIYMRALFGGLVTLAIALGVTAFTQPRKVEELPGLTLGTLRAGMILYKGGAPNLADAAPTRPLRVATGGAIPGWVRLSPSAMERLQAHEGDMAYVTDARWWLGGLRSVRVRLGATHDGHEALLHEEDLRAGNLDPGRPVRIEKIL
jgi:SSS family solute:Na+ symporter